MSATIGKVTVKVGTARKEGTEGYGSIGATCEVEVEMLGAGAADLTEARDRWIAWCEQTVAEAIARQRAALDGGHGSAPMPAPARPAALPAPAPEPPRKERREWGGPAAAREREERRGGDRRDGGGNRDGVPRSGGALYARLKEMDEQTEGLGVVKHVSRWAKARGNNDRMSDWDRDDVRDGWAEAQTYLEALRESERLQPAGY